MQLQPTMDRILVEKMEDAMTNGGLIIPDSVTAQFPTAKAKVVAVGELETIIKPGDIILHFANTGIDIKHIMPNHRLIISREVLGVIK